MKDLDIIENIDIVFEFLFTNNNEYHDINNIMENTYLDPSSVRKSISALLNANLIEGKFTDERKKEYKANKYIKLNDWIYAIDVGINIELLEKYILLEENNEHIINYINNGNYDNFKKEKEEQKKTSHKEYLKGKAMSQYAVKEIKKIYEINKNALNNYLNKKEKSPKDKLMIAVFSSYSDSLKNTLDFIVEKYISFDNKE